ncbi:hypothetical protein ACQ4N7_30025 [Nodosilinea sp. AN01ver1]|uniref:hypothetical protein n=1 Tax=Nodosilinea sp. AN01ver1 TaxID=3423362 RepID=UPI003D320C85
MADVAVTRQVPVEGLSAHEWAEVQKQYASLDISICHDLGLSKGLETIQDRRLERLMAALLTFLNPRQVSIVLHLYRCKIARTSAPESRQLRQVNRMNLGT